MTIIIYHIMTFFDIYSIELYINPFQMALQCKRLRGGMAAVGEEEELEMIVRRNLGQNGLSLPWSLSLSCLRSVSCAHCCRAKSS